MVNYSTLRPFLFSIPPEAAHRVAIRALQLGLVPASRFTHPSLATTLSGLHLPNPVGLAAGFDKNAECVAGCLRAGFGFVEVGTVTPRAQPGNPQPRVFRLVESRALINRLGFNNEGVEAAVARLKARHCNVKKRSTVRHSGESRNLPEIVKMDSSFRWNDTVVGGNIGKNKDSADAVADYVSAMQALYPHVNYFTANISSPNTPGLRDMQQADTLRALIQALHAVRAERVKNNERALPIFIKIAPDNDDAMLEKIAEVARETQLDGLIVGNTTITRPVAGSHFANEAGGLSGAPLKALALDRLRTLRRLTGGRIPLIGVGGISSAEDAYARIRAGASAVQLYTALVYEGLGLVERINRGLVELLARDGFASVADAVGVDESYRRSK